jgi:5-methylcytosine-specific restriction protein A
MSGGWRSSDRGSRLPADWDKRVARTKRRARGRCEADEHVPECDGIGSQCDHHVPGDDHSLGNLRWLSGPCHTAKTQREAAAARQAMLAKLKHPSTRVGHPGLL